AWTESDAQHLQARHAPTQADDVLAALVRDVAAEHTSARVEQRQDRAGNRCACCAVADDAAQLLCTRASRREQQRTNEQRESSCHRRIGRSSSRTVTKLPTTS